MRTSGSPWCTPRPSSICAPMEECCFIIWNSSFVSLPGLFNIFSSIAIFPISCRAEASLIRAIFPALSS